MRADLVRAPHDCGDVLDLGRLEQHVGDRDEERALVDRVDDRRVVRDDDDLELRLRLVQVADRREVPVFVDDAVPTRIDRPKARQHDRFGDRDVLMHDRRTGRGADDSADLVADLERHRPPSLGPRADAARLPRVRVLGDAILGPRGHRAERVVDQVRRIGEDRELRAVVGQLHRA